MKNLFICFLIILTIQVKSQEIVKPASRIDKSTIGLGFGLDYGEFGLNITSSLTKNIALIAGGGYTVYGFGYNGGIKLRYISDKNTARISPFLICLYGINTILVDRSDPENSQSYRGITYGAGIDFNFMPRKNGLWSLAIMLPQRSQELTYIANAENVVGISIGYKLIIN